MRVYILVYIILLLHEVPVTCSLGGLDLCITVGVKKGH